MGSRHGQPLARSSSGGSFALPGPCLCAARAGPIGLHRWLGCQPGSIQRAFREKVKVTAGRGRARFQVWSELCIATVIKHTCKKRVVEITRNMTLGTLEHASELLQVSSGGAVLNTAFIERFNGTVRERLANLTRRCRHAAGRLETLEAGMYLIGCTYNFCWPHHELSKPHHAGQACTPAMASGLADHVWRVRDLLEYRLVPAPWVEPRRRGRPRTRLLPDPTQPKRPRGRPRIRPLPDVSVFKRPRGRPRKAALAPTTS